jgi:hypothetical protein
MATGPTCAAVWRELAHQSFAILSHVDGRGVPRSSGVVYGLHQQRLYVVVAPEGRKARDIATGDHVSVTVPVRRGGVLALAMPIPPATITFQAVAAVYPPGSPDVPTLPAGLARLLPPDDATACLIELTPVGRFLTYGIGIGLLDMRIPSRARGSVPVAA